MLDRITKGKILKPPKIILYGVGGIGKTTFSSKFPDPIFICTEEGTDQIDTSRFPKATCWLDVLDQVISLNGEHSYKTLVIDSLDELERLIHKDVAAKNNKNHISEIGFQRGYEEAVARFQELLELLDNLRERKKMMIVIIAHSKVERFNSPTMEPYDRYQLDLHKKAWPMMIEWSDATLFVNYKIFTKKEGESFGQAVYKAIGDGERTLFTTEKPSFIAKNRYGLPEEMPFDVMTLLKSIKSSMVA